MDPVSQIAIRYGHSTSEEEVEKSVAGHENLSRPSPSIAPFVRSPPQDDCSSDRGMNPEKSSSSKRRQDGKAENRFRSAKRLPVSRRRAVRRRRLKLRATDDEDGGASEDLKFLELMALTDNAGGSDAVNVPLGEADDEPGFVTAPETLAAADGGGGVRNLSDDGNAAAFNGNSALRQSPAASPAEFIRVGPTSLPAEDLGFEKPGIGAVSVHSVMKTLLDVVGVLANESGHGVGDENIIEVAKRAGYVFPQPKWRRAGGYT